MEESFLQDHFYKNHFFKDFSPKVIKQIGHSARLKKLATGETLFSQQRESNSLFLILQGKIDRVYILENEQRHIDVVGPGDLIGGFSFLGHSKPFLSASTIEECQVLELPNNIFQQLAPSHPDEVTHFKNLLNHELRKTQLTLSLRLNDLFKDLSKNVFDALQAEMQLKTLASDTLLCKEGQIANEMYVVVYGKLRIFTENDAQQVKVLKDVGRGSAVGEIGVITSEQRTASVRAIRDSSIAVLSKESFERLLVKFPVVMNRTFVKNIILHLVTNAKKPVSPANSYSLIALNPLLQLGEIAHQLQKCLSAYGKTLILDSSICDQSLSSTDISQIDLNDSRNNALIQWLNEQELSYQYLIYVTDPGMTQWTKRCLRQADHLLMVANANDDKQLTQYESEIKQNSRFSYSKKTLLIMHNASTKMPSGSVDWLNEREAPYFHHARYNTNSDFQRVARFLTGRANGLVLGGGGARGFAHIGVIRAMEELNIPIDIVGGNSIGAVVAAQCAMQWPYQEMIDRIIHLSKGGEQFTLPLVSLFTGKNMEKGFKEMFGDSHIEDLWRKFYCVSCNLSRAKVMVHNNGLVKDAVRYSNAPPGLFPPIVKNGDLLVDGALLNNIPVDIMQRINEGGNIIAIDVNIKEEMLNSTEYGTSLSGFKVLASRLNPFKPAINIPNMIELLSRASTIGGIAQQQKGMQGLADLYLLPPVKQFALMDYKKGTEIAQLSYEYAMPLLEDWKKITDNE